MSDRGRGAGGEERADGRSASHAAALALLAALVASGSGCSTVVDVVAGVFGPGEVGGEVDAHVVYRLRPDCPALLARTISHGYTVLTPRGMPDGIEGEPEMLGAFVEETGVFEGPVRSGEVVFRYVPPAASETWDAGPVDLVADVDAVRLDLDEGAGRLVALCGPLPVPVAPDSTIPRIPGRQP